MFICYQAGVDDNGKIQHINASITEDDGSSHNENILDFVVGGFPNCYNTEYFNLKTFAVLTDLPSNTFARAPGELSNTPTTLFAIMKKKLYCIVK